MFQFSCRFAFYQLFVFQTGHQKEREFWLVISETMFSQVRWPNQQCQSTEFPDEVQFFKTYT